jgi:hypothetical protein
MLLGGLLVGLTPLVSTQDAQKPSFLGTWRVVPDNSGRPPSLGDGFTATQDDGGFVIQRLGSSALNRYAFGAAGQPNTTGGSDSILTAKWDGSRLILDSKVLNPGRNAASAIRRVLSLDEKGQLVVETATTPPSAVWTSVYRRQSKS